MKILIMTILVVAVLEFVHTVLTPLRGIRFVKKADFLLHKVGTSLVIAMYLSDYSIGLLGCVLALAAYWICRANRKYILAVGKAVWKTYGKSGMNKITHDAQEFLSQKIAVPATASPVATPSDNPPIETEKQEESPDSGEQTDGENPEENPLDTFTAGPVDVDID